MLEPHLNPATVELLHDTTWWVASVEATRTEGLDRKAASLAGFASVILSLTATLGVNLLEGIGQSWLRGAAVALHLGGILALVCSVGLAVRILLSKELLTLGMAYLERFPRGSEGRKAPNEVRGETMAGLIKAVARERVVNDGKASQVRGAFVLLFVGLVLVAAQASILAVEELFS